MGKNAKAPLSLLQRRLSRFSALETVLGQNWLADEYEKQFSKWNLITGWLSLYDRCCRVGLGALDSTLELLNTLPDGGFTAVTKKVNAHCDRGQFKSVLAELSWIAALHETGCRVLLEQELEEEGNRDVDMSAVLPDEQTTFHLEVYQI